MHSLRNTAIAAVLFAAPLYAGAAATTLASIIASSAEQAYPSVIYFNQVTKGGHFAAWEQPELFAAELRAAFKPLR